LERHELRAGNTRCYRAPLRMPPSLRRENIPARGCSCAKTIGMRWRTTAGGRNPCPQPIAPGSARRIHSLTWMASDGDKLDREEHLPSRQPLCRLSILILGTKVSHYGMWAI